MRQLVRDANFPPAGGWKNRFLITSSLQPQEQPVPAGYGLDGQLRLEAAPGQSAGLTVQNTRSHDDSESILRDWSAYNGQLPETTPTRPLSVVAPALHDFSVECEIEVTHGNGSVAFRLHDGSDHFEVHLPIGQSSGQFPAYAIASGPTGRQIPAQIPVRLIPGTRVHFEFQFVDRRAACWLNDQEIVPPWDFPDPIRERGGVSRPVQIGIENGGITLHRFRIWRDGYYRSEGEWGVQNPLILGADEYFMLGDNSYDSHDSRKWAVPTVRRQALLGKPSVRDRQARSSAGAGWNLLR